MLHCCITNTIKETSLHFYKQTYLISISMRVITEQHPLLMRVLDYILYLGSVCKYHSTIKKKSFFVCRLRSPLWGRRWCSDVYLMCFSRKEEVCQQERAVTLTYLNWPVLPTFLIRLKVRQVTGGLVLIYVQTPADLHSNGFQRPGHKWTELRKTLTPTRWWVWLCSFGEEPV